MYCDIDRVRMLSGLSTTSVSDIYLEQMIKYSTERVNADISKRVTLETLVYLDKYRSNVINGVNTTFYVLNSWKFFFGDFNNDGKFNTSDVEVWDYNQSDGTRTQVTPATVDIRGSFTVTTPIESNHELRVSYRYCPLPISPTVDGLIADATAYLTGSIAYTKISPADAGKIQIGRMKYDTGSGLTAGGPAFKLLQTYRELVKRIDYMYTERISPGIRYYSMDLDNAVLMPDQELQNSNTQGYNSSGVSGPGYGGGGSI